MKRIAQTVRVLDDERRPVPGATLAIIKADGPFPELAYRTGEEGTVRIGLPQGRVTLEVIAPGKPRQRAVVEVGNDEGAVHEVVFTPGRGPRPRCPEAVEERAARLVALAKAFSPPRVDAVESTTSAMPSEEEIGKRVASRLNRAGLPAGAAEAIGRATAARGASLVESARAGSLRREDLATNDLAALEAVIFATTRPAWFVRNNTPDAETALAADRYWVQHITRIFLEIASACRRVGAIFREEAGSRTQVGTGWMIGDGLLATNAHVAEHLYRQKLSGPTDPVTGWQRRPGVTGAVDFRFERGQGTGARFPIVGHRYIECDQKGPDIAVLAVAPAGGLQPPTPLPVEGNSACGAASARALLFAIGHPIADVMADKNVAAVFGDIDGTKRFSPGESRGHFSDFVLGHDCSTVNGSSGSPIIEFSSARVVGLHYWGLPGERNEAVFLPAIRSHPALVHAGVTG